MTSPPVINWGVLDRLVRDLHGEANESYTTFNIFTDFRAFYPFVGGVPETHALNLIDPALFSIVWHGSPTHTGNGILTDGATQYGDTTVNVMGQMALFDKSAGMYTKSRPESSGYPWNWGAYEGPLFGCRIHSSNLCSGIGINVLTDVTPYETLGKYHSVDIESSVLAKLYSDGIAIKNFNGVGPTAPNATVYIGGMQGPFYAPIDCQTFWLGKSFSAAEHEFIYNAVTAFNTALGRS